MNAVLITGVSSGIGYDATRHLIEHGYTVFGSLRTKADGARLRADFPERFHPLLFDVTDREGIRGAVEEVRNLLDGRILRALVNNAGLVAPGPMMLLEDEDFEYQLRVNLLGLRTITNSFLPLLGVPVGARSPDPSRPRRVARPGRIINLSSISGVLNTPMNGSYCVAKHALESLGDVYRQELHMYGIDVVSIRPGPIESRIWEKNLSALDRFSDTDFGPLVKATGALLRKAQEDALPAAVVSRLVQRVIEAKRPRRAYIVHRQRLLMHVMTRFLPASVVDGLIRRSLS